MTPPRKQWYDKLADALLGDDELGANGGQNRYALICQKCFAHNGLVKEEQWEDARAYHQIFTSSLGLILICRVRLP